MTSLGSSPVGGITFPRPVLTSATVTSTAQAVVRWGAVEYATHYIIYRATSRWGTYSRIGRVSGTTYTSGVLDPGTYYYYIMPQRSNSAGTYTGGLRSLLAILTAGQVQTTYRALLIGQVSYSSGTCNRNWADVQTMQTLLNKCSYNAQKYTITTAKDITKTSVQSRIQSAFSGATVNDVSLFLFAGHGYTGTTGSTAGALVCYDGTFITTAELASWLSAIPGKVIVLLGTCGSGSAIYSENGVLAGNATEFDEKSFNQKVIQSFSGYTVTVPNPETNIGELRQSKFYVLTAAAHGETSWGHEGDTPGNYFVIWMAQGLSYDYATGEWYSGIPADTSGDSKVSLAECYTYIQRIADATPFTSEGVTYYQHQQIYPTGSTFTLFDL